MRRRAPLLLAAWVVVTTGVLWFLGVGGFRFGYVLVGVVLVVGTAALTLALRQRPWLPALVVLGIVLTVVLVDRSPASKGRLEEQLDGLNLPFFETESTAASGNSRCLPRCPQVRRTYRSGVAAPEAAVTTVAGALVQAKLVADANDLFPEGRAPTEYTLRRQGLRVAVKAVRVTDEGRLPFVRVTITATSSRG